MNTSVKSFHPCKSVIPTVLSYDIIKAHGGELTLITNEGNGSEFQIKLRTHL